MKRGKSKRSLTAVLPAHLQALMLRLLQKAPKGGTRAAAGSIPMMATDVAAKVRRAISQNVLEAVVAVNIKLLLKECS